MFNIVKDRTFEREVTVIIPSESGDTKGRFTAVFRVLPHSRLEELNDDRSMAKAVLVSVKGVGDEQGNPLPDDQALEAVLEDTACITAVAAHYMREVKAKNLRQGN